jgi:thioredoxin 1
VIVIVALNDGNFTEEVLGPTIPVLVDFWSASCVPCKLIAPIVEEIEREHSGRLKVCAFDVEQEARTLSTYGILSIPTLLIFKEGEVRDQIVGCVSKEHILEKLESVI